jgi:hypothetical protein
MVLRKPIALQDVVPAIESHLDNINLLGDDLNSFAREVFEAAIDFGYTGIFVNYPKVEEETFALVPMRWKEAIALTGCITPHLRLLDGAIARLAIGRVFTQLRIAKTRSSLLESLVRQKSSGSRFTTCLRGAAAIDSFRD